MQPFSRKMAWVAWLLASCFYAYQYILRVIPGIMLNDITQRFNIDAGLFGQFTGVYYIGYALMQFPIGIMVDRFGSRKVMTGCIVLTIIGLIPMLVADHWIYLLIGRAVIGIGSSAAILNVFNIVRMAFAEKSFSRMLSFSVTLGLLGAIYGGYPVSLMNQNLGYQASIGIFCLIGICLACITFIVIPETKPSETRSTIFSSVKTIFTNPKVVVLCFCAGLLVGPLEGFADVWGSAFLQRVYGIDITTANTLPSLIFIGMCFGAPILSIIAEKTGYYLGIIVVVGIIMCLLFTGLILGGFGVSSISFSFIIVGICCAYQILAIYKASTYVPENIKGLTTAVANIIIMAFGYIFHTSIGLVVHYYGGSSSAKALIYGIWVIPISLFIGVVGLCLLGRTASSKIAAENYEQVCLAKDN